MQKKNHRNCIFRLVQFSSREIRLKNGGFAVQKRLDLIRERKKNSNNEALRKAVEEVEEEGGKLKNYEIRKGEAQIKNLRSASDFNIFKHSSITELILIFGLNHSRALGSQGANGLKEIDDLFVLKTLENDAQGDENACTTDASTTI